MSGKYINSNKECADTFPQSQHTLLCHSKWPVSLHWTAGLWFHGLSINSYVVRWMRNRKSILVKSVACEVKVQVLASPQNMWVSLCKFFKLFVPQRPHVDYGVDNSTYFIVSWWALGERIYETVWGLCLVCSISSIMLAVIIVWSKSVLFYLLHIFHMIFMR